MQLWKVIVSTGSIWHLAQFKEIYKSFDSFYSSSQSFLFRKMAIRLFVVLTLFLTKCLQAKNNLCLALDKRATDDHGNVC